MIGESVTVIAELFGQQLDVVFAQSRGGHFIYGDNRDRAAALLKLCIARIEQLPAQLLARLAAFLLRLQLDNRKRILSLSVFSVRDADDSASSDRTSSFRKMQVRQAI